MSREKEHALFDAIKQGDMQKMEILLKEGVNVNAEDSNSKRAIELLVANQNLAGVKILLKYNADFTVKCNSKGEFSAFIPSLVKKENTELKDLVDLEISFLNNNFRIFQVRLDKPIFKGQTSLIEEKNNKYKLLEDFTELKLEVFRVSDIQNNKTALNEYVEKLQILDDFLKTNQLESKISEYKEKEWFISENSANFENDYYIEECVDPLGKQIDLYTR